MEDIVISGISGRFPESENVDQFMENLYSRTDFLTEDDRRWPPGYLGLPRRSGKLTDITKFDERFFSINDDQADLMDAQIRIMLELTYEAIWDAGLEPNSLSGSRTGTFIGSIYSEVPIAQEQDMTKITGCHQNFGGIVSRIFNFTGPSVVLDTACSSSFFALNEAFVSMKNNLCDQALVIGLNMALRPSSHLEFHLWNMLSPDGYCRCLDSEANGYAKAEACAVILLEKRSKAKRIYATLVNAMANCDGYKEQGLTFPSSDAQAKLISKVYAQANIDPNQVNYMEAHCTGTKAGDPVEMSAIVKTMCTERSQPLLIGAVKSNIGHTEATSGLCSLTKVIFSMENQCIPANMHFNAPNPQIPGLMSGVLKPITVNTPFEDKLVSLNSFGFGGANVHIIVRGQDKETSAGSKVIFEDIPRLILMCGRNKEALEYSLKKILAKRDSWTQDYLSLINDISKTSPFKNEKTAYLGMTYRGYVIIKQNTNEDNYTALEVPQNEGEVWYIISGLGSQWPLMAKPLMKVRVFAESVKKSAQILTEYDLDLLKILMDNNENDHNCPLNVSLSLVVIQIGLIDVLNELGITPNGIIGHSFGELASNYADQCLTREETIKITYFMGRHVRDMKTAGKMAVVGLKLEEIQRRLPEDVYIGCHNAEDSFTISGGESAMDKFTAQLNDEGIFVQSVDSCGHALHCPHMSHNGSALLEKLNSIIPGEKESSSKWFSTVYPRSDERGHFVTADYFKHCLERPVLFSQALKHIPKGAVLIEISAHNLFESTIKRSLGSDVTYIPLMRKNEDIDYFFENIGRIYCSGINPRIERLYPKVDYPVVRGTPALSPLVKWEHTKSHTVYQYPEYYNQNGFADNSVEIYLQDSEYSYLSDHCIDGRVLFPATAYLLIVWKHLALKMGMPFMEVPVHFENVRFLRATSLPNEGRVMFKVKIDDSNGQFVVTESGSVTTTGKISMLHLSGEQFERQFGELINLSSSNPGRQKVIHLKDPDIYKELRIRGYDYGKSFRCVTTALIKESCVQAQIKWINWVTFVDSILQMLILSNKSRGLYLPTGVDSLKCDLAQFKAIQDGVDINLPVIFDNYTGTCASQFLELKGIRVSQATRKVARSPIVEQYTFVPYEQTSCTMQQNQLLFGYQQKCDELASKLAEKYSIPVQDMNNNQAQVQSFAESLRETDFKDEKHVLLNILQELISGKLDKFSKESKDTFHQLDDLDNDLMNTSFMREDYIRPLIDTVVENIGFNSKRINVLEVSRSQLIMAQNIIQWIGLSRFDTQINYSLLHPMDSPLNPELINGIECHKWQTYNGSLPRSLSTYDLIVYVEKHSLIPLKNENIFRLKFESLLDLVKDNGFLIVVFKNGLNFAEQVLVDIKNRIDNEFGVKNDYFDQRRDVFIAEAKSTGFSLIATKVDAISNKTSLTFRKISGISLLAEQIFIRITNDNCEQWIEKLQNQLKTIEDRPESQNIWLLAEDCPTIGIMGFVNCLRKEQNGHRIRCIFNYDFKAMNDTNILNNSKLMEKMIKNNQLMNVLSSDNTVGSFRHLSLKLNERRVMSAHSYLNFQTKGDLSSFQWFEAQHKYWPLGKTTNQQLIDVYYAPLNFRDIMLATGKLSADALPGGMSLTDCILGLEFAGIDENNNKVMGLVPSKGLATSVVTEDMDFVWEIPEHWSMEEASTVPVVYATAYYALIMRGKLRPKESVLIHSGSGGVGQAAIAICLSMGCRLFITCGSDAKRNFLKKEFSPKLSDEDFWTSRDSSFESFIMRETNGRGVDLVLNSLAEDKLQASVRCLATNGRFLEIGKYDLSQNNELDLLTLFLNKTFHGILLDSLFVDSSKCSPVLRAQKRRLKQLIENGIREGTVRPLTSTVFDSSKVEQAFRFMASGHHIGKVVLKIRDERKDKSVEYPAIPRTVFKPNKCYIIIGGLGGFGLELVNWMIERGAKNFMLTSRSGFRTGYQRYRINSFETIGINIEISTKNVCDSNQTRELIESASKVGGAQGVAGIFNLAMVLSDALFENQTSDNFKKVLAPKAVAVENLDKVSRSLCPDLEHFVCFSSVSCGRGNSGQTNYGFANSIMERVCERRRTSGLPALAVQWGAVGDVGVVAESMGGNDIVVGGTLPQKISSCLATLDSILGLEYPIVSSFVRPDLKRVDSNKKKRLIDRIAVIMGLPDYKKLDPKLSLAELGIDSLMGFEVKQTLDRDYELNLRTEDIRRLTIKQILDIGHKK